jgi:hypothetical protein
MPGQTGRRFKGSGAARAAIRAARPSRGALDIVTLHFSKIHSPENGRMTGLVSDFCGRLHQ